MEMSLTRDMVSETKLTCALEFPTLKRAVFVAASRGGYILAVAHTIVSNLVATRIRKTLFSACDVSWRPTGQDQLSAWHRSRVLVRGYYFGSPGDH